MMPSNSKAATRNDINYVASSAGLMTATPSDASVDEMIPGDIETARQFGQRVAAAAALLVARPERVPNPNPVIELEGEIA
jgi:NAD(P)H dehydrogenase (quinone)